jgi:hypothetical protein
VEALVGLARVRAVMDYVVELIERDGNLFEGRRPAGSFTS